MTRDQHKSRQALLIIGMHRSGTSALTRIINLHGVPLGSELPEAAFDNEAGFWENPRVVNLHERLLAELGSSWDDPRELREGWLDEVMATAYLDELVGLIAAEFGDARIWAVKDPRLCRLLPLWLKALARLDIEPKLIFALRHPGEVVGSLMLRNGLSAATASMLWLRHLAEPVQASRNLLRCAVDYDELLLDWRSCMARIKSDLAVEWPVPSQVCAPEAEAHLRRDLRHQNASTAQDLLPAAWRHLLLDVHASGLAVARGEAGWENLDTKLQVLIAQFEFARPLMADLLPKSGQDCLQVRLDQAEHDRAVYRTEAERLFGECVSAQVVLQESEIARQESEVARQELRGEIAKLQARLRIMEQVRNELELIKSSRSWRWTRPLRFASRTIHQRGLDEQDQRRIAQLLGRKKGASGSATLNPLSSTDEGTDASVMPQLAPPSVGLRDFFVWAVIDWHFRIQRPQHISRELALAGHRVFYISNNFVDRSEPGFNVESLDSEGRLFQIHLHLRGSPMIYHATPDAATRSQLRAGIGMLLAWTRGGACASLIQHPYWLETAQVLPNQRIVYDCMDHHGGFADNSDEVLEREHELMRDADLLVVTSDWLNNETGKYNPRRMMIRNACQYEHFATRPERIFKDGQGRRVIGYYGAIAEWFDLELLEKVARRFSDCLVLLVGADTSGAQQRLQALDNVEFTGEVPYASLPYYLEGFDVCLLPFQVIPLTLATNPVKVYEYLSAGKDVVSIELPEIRQFGNLVRTGTDHGSFLDAVAAALAAIPDPAVIAQRKQFAAEQTWAHRVQDLVQGIEALPEPRVSVVVVTYNNLELTKACLYSLEQYSDYANLEVIVVDNASADGTPAYLKEWAAAGRDRRIIMNSDNRGFAAANNQGLALASGDYLVMLNNDTYVTPGWIATLVGHLRRSENLGMLGPVTNNIGNEARIEIRYDNMDEMLQVAAAYTSHHAGQLTPLRTAAFFCVMLRRSVYEKVGSLDEAFGIGFFEDDDYCRRVEQAGWTIACADDVFVHHNLSASFNKLKQETRQALFEQNKAAYEAKWGKWVPHKYRGA